MAMGKRQEESIRLGLPKFTNLDEAIQYLHNTLHTLYYGGKYSSKAFKHTLSLELPFSSKDGTLKLVSSHIDELHTPPYDKLGPYNSLFDKAVLSGNLEVATLLSNICTNPNFASNFLYRELTYNSPDVVRLLLSRGEIVDNNVALTYAVLCSPKSVVLLAVNSNFRFGVIERHAFTALVTIGYSPKTYQCPDDNIISYKSTPEVVLKYAAVALAAIAAACATFVGSVAAQRAVSSMISK